MTTISKDDILKQCIDKVEQMITVNEGKLEPSLHSTLKFVLNTLTSLRSDVNSNKPISPDVLGDFDKVLSISTRLFDGNSLDELLWSLNNRIER